MDGREAEAVYHRRIKNKMNPQSSLQPFFALLNMVADKRKEGCVKVCEVLALDPAISRFLQEKENAHIDKPFGEGLEKVSGIIQKSKVERSIADWPFENFWGKPHEPKHSKLLAYFIDPKQEHLYGKVLLKELLKVCKKEGLEIDTHCEVTNEKDHIDIVVKRRAQKAQGESESDNNKNYALIFENKIHGAVNQTGAPGTSGQLDTYVEAMKNEEFAYEQIHVFYLPLRADKDPDSKDKDAVIKKVGEKNYKKITFENEILTWLKNIAGKEYGKDEGMRDNLNHYKNLISFLINQNKINSMKSKIFEQLKDIENKGDALPSPEDAIRAQEAVNELVPCLQIYNSLKAVKAEIREIQKDPQIKYEDIFPYENGIAVGVKVSDGEATFWFGYDLDDTGWFFAIHRLVKNIQIPEPFPPDRNHWNGDTDVRYEYADKVIENGVDFARLDLSKAYVQMAAKKLLEMARSFEPKPENIIASSAN
jgi:hypothetical protein